MGLGGGVGNRLHLHKYFGRRERYIFHLRIHEETQSLPFAIFLQSKHEIKLENMSSHHMHETPTLVEIF